MPFGMKAQHMDAQRYWKDFDFNDTTLIGSERLDDGMTNFLYAFSLPDDTDVRKFDSLSVKNTGLILEKAKVNPKMYEYVLLFLLNG